MFQALQYLKDNQWEALTDADGGELVFEHIEDVVKHLKDLGDGQVLVVPHDVLSQIRE